MKKIIAVAFSLVMFTTNDASARKWWEKVLFGDNSQTEAEKERNAEIQRNLNRNTAQFNTQKQDGRRFIGVTLSQDACTASAKEGGCSEAAYYPENGYCFCK